MDVANAISAYKRANGEYVVFVEEDARGKVLMYRWTPAAGQKSQGGKKGAKDQAAGNGIGEG